MINLYRRFTQKPQPKAVNIVAQRFLQAFNDHGVQPSQIPRLMPQIRLDDLKSEEALLAVLTPAILDQTAKFFGIRSEWLEGVDDKIYEYQSCYKDSAIFFEVLASLQSRTDLNTLSCPLRVLTSTKKLDCTDDNQQLLAPILVEKIAELGEDSIYRYHIFNDGFDWGYRPTRIQLKALARLIYTVLHIPVPLYIVSPAELQSIIEQEAIPQNIVNRGLLTTPSLEDFALSHAESGIAKEIGELPYVLLYIEEYKLASLIAEKPLFTLQPGEPTAQPHTAPELSPPTATPTKTGKRAQNSQDLWMPVRNTVQAWWAEEGDALHIAQAIARIKTLPHLKAGALSDSAIRKHIADLAPANVRGKSGRKPKQST